MENTYIAIDLKSFYASVECVERNLDPLRTNLVVADNSRTDKTICLAVTPPLKKHGVSGRPRLFEVVQKVREINAVRRSSAPRGVFTGKSFDDEELTFHRELELDYIVAVPRMALYVDYSRRIYSIYLRYIAPEDIHVYSIDEVFMDVTPYLNMYKMSARELTEKIIHDVYFETGITATAGIGTNLYLCKVAMDIVAKHTEADRHGVRIAQLDEYSYRRRLWTHRPLTDFWRVGRGYARKLEKKGLCTMGDIARCSIGKRNDYYNENLLYKMFGVNAELLIDHAWGYEPCTMSDIKQYKPSSNGISSGQVLHCAYTNEKALLVAKEMAESIAFNLLRCKMLTDNISLSVGYDIENLTDEKIRNSYKGKIKVDSYGRLVPESAHGSISLRQSTSSMGEIMDAVSKLYNRITEPNLLVRRLTISANNLVSEKDVQNVQGVQLDFFSMLDKDNEKEKIKEEKNIQEAILSIREKYGNNALFRGMDLEEGATAIERNNQIGGHKA